MARADGQPEASDTTQLPQWLEQLDQAPPPGSTGSDVPIAFMIGWGTLCSLALGAGGAVGFRAFEGSVAYEALDKMDRPTAAAEAQAVRVASRALGWGTALAFGSALVGVVGARAMGLCSAADVAESARARLQPFDDWLQRNGQWLQRAPEGCTSTIEEVQGWYAHVRSRWQASWLAGSVRSRVERVVRHHEEKEAAANDDADT